MIISFQAKFNELLLEVRNGLHDEKDDGKCNMRIDDLFKLLQHSECLEDAFVAEESIKEVWKAHLNQTIRWSLDVGIARLLRGDKIAALDIYNNIVDGEDPEYLEAWNKKATCHYVSSLFAQYGWRFENYSNRQNIVLP